MRAVIYRETGPSSVLEVVERDLPEPGPGEVRVRVVRSGVNPTDWKFRTGNMAGHDEVVPGQDGAGVIDAVGPGVDRYAVGDRVWTVLAQHGRPYGTAADYTVQPVERVAPLPEGASYDLGASLGVPAVTAHRALTAAQDGPDRLAPGALDGKVVLVAGGAGAVGNAAIQLARWAGATVITTVSSDDKAALATAAGAHHTVNYRDGDTARQILAIAPDGVDIAVEVAPAQNIGIDLEVVRVHGLVSIYANNGGDEMTMPLRAAFGKNLRFQFLILYTLHEHLVQAAVEDVNAAVAAGALRVGEDAGIALHHFPLESTAAAQDAVEGGAVGKVLIDVDRDVR
ncbi:MULTISPECIES: NADPH:quinone reductase [unclassified Nocardioides]|uniref:NADPH:quinone reductase n=1 Tax=unclassified Nocardioides TaxID=2615069 RepID=UPI0009EFD5F3|nr:MULTISPECIES: NADPH:quinone reductase [unclassified Nocardioides]GAW49487.1 alcohol dehydrogenase [Nocardioides sp. PD653-B2]GAW54999.1 alcohol dehydrogenase [Nocardioides sp. PD653]